MTLQSAINSIKRSPDQSSARSQAAASGMLAAAESAVGSTSFHEDTLSVLNQLALAKAHLDIAACHSPEVTSITAQLLGQAQDFVENETIACTEWPLPSEVVQVVKTLASALGSA